MLKTFFKKSLAAFGLEIRRRRIEYEIKTLEGVTFPVELKSEDRDIIQYVVDNSLSMVSPEKLWTTAMACRHVVESEIPGDFVECGVWRGGNSIIAAAIFRSLGSDRHIHLFDTFKGMTEPSFSDTSLRDGTDSKEVFMLGQQADHNEWCFAAIEEVRNNFEKLGLLSDRIHFIEGDVEQTLSLPTILPSRVAVLRLDTDWYESTAKELEVLYPRLSVGGVIIIDDYGDWAGAKKATDEYFSAVAAKPFLHVIDAGGRIGIKAR